MSVGAGTVADCWQITERGSAFSYLFLGQFLGPLIGNKLHEIKLLYYTNTIQKQDPSLVVVLLQQLAGEVCSGFVQVMAYFYLYSSFYSSLKHIA